MSSGFAERQERPPSTIHRDDKSQDGKISWDGEIGRACGWFLELPVPVVLVAMWLLGATLVGLCAVAFYSTWSWMAGA